MPVFNILHLIFSQTFIVSVAVHEEKNPPVKKQLGLPDGDKENRWWRHLLAEEAL